MISFVHYDTINLYQLLQFAYLLHRTRDLVQTPKGYITLSLLLTPIYTNCSYCSLFVSYFLDFFNYWGSNNLVFSYIWLRLCFKGVYYRLVLPLRLRLDFSLVGLSMSLPYFSRLMLYILSDKARSLANWDMFSYFPRRSYDSFLYSIDYNSPLY